MTSGIVISLLLLWAPASPGIETQAYLSSERNPVAVMREEVKSANTSLFLVLYKFDEASLEKVARHALERGVTIRIVADRGEAERSRSRIKELQKKGAGVRLWKKGKLHAKFGIVDGKRVVTGSFNWTESAQHDNMELIVISEEPTMVKRFQELFEQLWDAAEPVDL
jgi:phosphatidylserine/phosphatidylglycerophosphate/cardiolipin synthase-like enzyme